jgi:hypothetical protein
MRLEIKRSWKPHDMRSFIEILKNLPKSTKLLNDDGKFAFVFDEEELYFAGRITDMIGTALLYQHSDTSSLVVNSPDTVRDLLSVIHHLVSQGIVDNRLAVSGTVSKFIQRTETVLYVNVSTKHGQA